jgi:hypothetical protein
MPNDPADLKTTYYEAGARAYCAARGWDADEVVQAPPHPKGYAVARRWPRWREVAA